jgi:hypothetical protein
MEGAAKFALCGIEQPFAQVHVQANTNALFDRLDATADFDVLACADNQVASIQVNCQVESHQSSQNPDRD